MTNANASDRSTTTTVLPVRKEIELPCPAVDAFRMFTQEIGQWWPLHTHSVFAERSRGCALDPGVGGQFYEIAPDGARQTWGTVRVWDPPHRVAFTFHPGREPETAGIVEVRFAASGSGSRVVLEHSGWELLGEKGLAMRSGYDHGWGVVFGQHFYDHCTNPLRT